MENGVPADETPLETALRLLDEEKPAEAAEILGALTAEGRGGVLARLTLARALLAAGRRGEAVEAALETQSLHPDLAEAALGLGAAYLAAEQIPEAIAALQRAMRIDPGNGEARFLIGAAWLEAGEADLALAAFSVLSGMPGLAEAIAEAEAMKARPRSDAGYVRHLFDQFSADYDTRMLETLSYRAPAILRELAALVIPGATGLDILDLGCGTGLSGAAFKDRAGRLDGIDLSPAMLEKAKERGVYDSLTAADIEAGLGNAAYDLILAADTLVYLGDLKAVFAAAFAALRPGGFFLFTVESKDGEGFELGPKRRWRHGETYVRAASAEAGFALAGMMECVPRHEAHQPVNGFAVALRK